MTRILHGDCLAILPTLANNSVDAIVTDPPYHLGVQPRQTVTTSSVVRKVHMTGFMHKTWDGGDIAFQSDVWRECLRVLKPGGHLCAFGGTRTHHRIWCAIEDAGFVIRDTLMWITGQGFPKSLDVAKSMQSANRMGSARFNNSDPTAFDDNEATAPKPGSLFQSWATWTETNATVNDPIAETWQGFGTALKPSYEPIILARKPLSEKTVAENVLAHGTGALNINACRVGTDTVGWDGKGRTDSATTFRDDLVGGFRFADGYPRPVTGRWPANLLTDGSPEVVECFPQSKSCDTPSNARPAGSILHGRRSQGSIYPGEDGSAARFFPALGYNDDERRVFYCAKASKRDRNGSKHPTVKPIRLMEWLCQLITPPNGVILDPFAGSGTTGQAAKNLGFDFILIEQDTEYLADIHRRLAPLTVP